MPLVYGGGDATAIRNVIASPAAITAHVQALVNLVVSKSYDGIELDYEHLWSASDRPGYTALVQQLAAALHANGKELSLAVPAIDVDNGQSGYDYAALAAAGADVIHLMGYDFHGLGSPHMGPLAPIGWVDAVAARVQQLGIASSFVLGIANYGVGSNWYANSATVVSQCGAGYSTTTDHMLTCSFGVYTAGISPHCTTAQGDVWFEDGASIAEKARTAQARGLHGVAYYDLGGEAPGLFDALRAAYP
jgi:spore germination protein YaaH